MRAAFPFHVGPHGGTAAATEPEYVRGLIEQVLFTSPGERVNRPDFGSGVRKLVFAPGDGERLTATEFLVQGALQQWLGGIVSVEAVNISHLGEAVQVVVQYRILYTQEDHLAEFTAGIA